jgi:hypothetical protein
MNRNVCQVHDTTGQICGLTNGMPLRGTLEAVKFPREGAGLLFSLVDTDGVVELGESVTRVEPGQIVDCFTYASLL